MELSRVKIDLNKAQAQAEQFAPIFRQFQQLAANGADRADGKNPFPYGEGTAAALIRKMPQRVLRKTMSGSVRNIADTFMSTVMEFVAQEIILRNACRKSGLIQTLWHVVESSIIYGCSTVTPFFTKVGNTYTVDFKTHFWEDVFPVPGTTNINDSDVFIREWWTKEDVKALLKSSEDDDKINKDEVNRLLEGDPGSRDSANQSEMNKMASVSNLGYKIYKYYVKEDGKYMMYVFTGNAEDFIMAQEIATRGHVTCYYSPDFETAYGRSILSLIGGLQWDIDDNMRNRRRSRELEINPMLVLEGLALGDIRVKPGTMVSVSRGSKIEPFVLNTPSLEKYTQDHAADQALIYQLAGYPEANMNSGVTADTAIGKTPTALKMAQSNLDYADNQVSHNLKLFMDLLLTMSLEIYFTAMPDQFLIELSPDYAERAIAAAPEREVSPGIFLVDSALDFFSYEVDINSGKDEANAQKLDSVSTILSLINGSEMMSMRVAELGILDDLIKEIVFASGLNSESVSKKLSLLNTPAAPTMGMPMQPPMQQQGVPQQAGPGGVM